MPWLHGPGESLSCSRPQVEKRASCVGSRVRRLYARGLAQPGSAGRRWVFSEGTLEYRESEARVCKATARGKVNLPIPDEDTWQVEVDDFIAAALDGTPLLVPPDAARRVVNIAAAAVTSAIEERRVTLSA